MIWTTTEGQRRPRAFVRVAVSVTVLGLVLAACGRAEDPTFGSPEDLDREDLIEMCELLAAGERPDGMDREEYDELLAAFRTLCDQMGVLLPPGTGPSQPGTPGDGAGTGAGTGANGGENGRTPFDGTRTDGHLVDADPFDDDVRRRAVEAGPQCDLASVDLSMSEVMKAPAIGPMGSPPFDAALAKAQYRAPAECLPEPYRSEWLVVAAAYEPLFDLLEAYAAASNQGFEALVDLGQQLGDIEANLAALESDEVQSAIASTDAFFGELRATGAWDRYDDASPWGRWWDSQEFRQLWSDAQWAAALGGAQLPDLPEVP